MTVGDGVAPLPEREEGGERVCPTCMGEPYHEPGCGGYPGPVGDCPDCGGYEEPRVCPTCGGGGYQLGPVNNYKPETCPTCNGTGEVKDGSV
jgi:hypothetical protein